MKKIIPPTKIALLKSLKEIKKGYYVDNWLNRKLGRVGQAYDIKLQEEFDKIDRISGGSFYKDDKKKELKRKEEIWFPIIFKNKEIYEEKKYGKKKWDTLFKTNTYFYIENTLNKDHYYIHTDKSKKESVGAYDAKNGKLYLKPGYDIKDFSKKKPKEYFPGGTYDDQRIINGELQSVNKNDYDRRNDSAGKESREL